MPTPSEPVTVNYLCPPQPAHPGRRRLSQLRVFAQLFFKRLCEPSRPWVAFVQPEHLGDIIASEPLVREVRRQNPGARILWFICRPYAALVRHHPFVDHAVEIECLSVWKRLRERIKFECVFEVFFEGRMCPSCREPLQRFKPSSILFENYYHAGSLLDAYAQSAGLSRPSDDQPQIFIPRRLRAGVDRFRLPEKFLVFHAKSSDRSRDWPAGKWQDLIRLLTLKHGIPVLEIGLETAVPGLMVSGYRSLCGELSLLEAAEVIGRAAVFIGVDSGPAHLANARRVPGVLLLGRWSLFYSYLPYSGFYAGSQDVTILRAAGPAAGISVFSVEEAVLQRWQAAAAALEER